MTEKGMFGNEPPLVPDLMEQVNQKLRPYIKSFMAEVVATSVDGAGRRKAQVRRTEEANPPPRPPYPVLGRVTVGEWVWCLADGAGGLLILPNFDDGVLVGELKPWAGSAAPDARYVLADGAAYSQSAYPEAFAVMGTAFNTGGEAAGTFRVPDMRSRVPVGAGAGTGLTNRARGSRFGAEQHTLTTNEMPAHSHGGSTSSTSQSHDHGDGTTSENTHLHTMTFENFGMSGTFGGGRRVYSPDDWPDATANQTTFSHTHDHNIANETQTHGHTISSSGGGAAHDNVQPSVAINYLVRMKP